MSAADRYDIGVVGFETTGYYGVIGTAADPAGSVYCGCSHPSYLEALRHAEAKRNEMYEAWQARPVATKQPMWVRVDGEYGDELGDEQPSYTRRDQHRDEERWSD